VLITGISKFSKVSLFSHLNNLSDITIHPDYSAICGYTQVELEHSFAEHLDAVADALPISRPELLDAMQRWYNGYSWDGRVKLYNPFGVLNFLDKRTFKNYWFASGNPNFLIEQMRVQSWYEVENVVVSDITLERFDLENLELSALLFQTGYLTIKHLDVMNGDMIMDYPNREVRESMYQVLISDLAANAARPHTGMTILDIRKAFIARDLGQVRTILNSLLTDLPHEVFDKKSEGLYHGLIHLIFKYLGMYADSEVHSARGRADAVVQTDTDVYLFEFKFNKTAQAALEQILKGDYAAKFRATGKPITAIGVNFDPALREISEWVEEVV
jgi:hypothetical protein